MSSTGLKFNLPIISTQIELEDMKFGKEPYKEVSLQNLVPKVDIVIALLQLCRRPLMEFLLIKSQVQSPFQNIIFI